MAFRRMKGRTKFMYLPVTASTVMSDRSLVAWSSGKLIAATTTTNPISIAGVLRKSGGIVSTDSDYATDSRLVAIEVPIENFVEWEADVTATLVVADRGTYCELTDASTINRGANTYTVCLITKFLSTTKCYCVLNIGPAGFGKGGAS